MRAHIHANWRILIWAATIGVLACGIQVSPWTLASKPAAACDEMIGPDETGSKTKSNRKRSTREKVMQIYYLEIVTKEVDAVCNAYASFNKVKFGKPDAGLGNARTAALPGGGMVGVRAPMHSAEEPIVRPYWLVDDIKGALAAAVDAGGEVAHPPLEIPGHGTFAIYIQGGINHGLWQK